jgi:transcriptional regulator with XRE-family HTH domain
MQCVTIYQLQSIFFIWNGGDFVIEYLRKLKKLTQEDVARALDITLRQYINIEKGVSEPKIKKGLLLAAILDVDPYKLFNVEKP